MAEFDKQHFETGRSADEVWRAINTPLVGELSKVIHPFVVVEYEDLSPEEMIDLGTIIKYGRSPEATKGMSVFAAKMSPKDADLRIDVFDPEQMIRKDVLVESKHEGFIQQTVESVDGSAVLVVEGALTLGGKYRGLDEIAMPMANKGVAVHHQQLVDNFPVILGE